MSSAGLAVVLLVASTFTLIVAANPFNEYAYSFNRDMLIDAEKKFERRADPSSRVSDRILKLQCGLTSQDNYVRTSHHQLCFPNCSVNV